MASSKNRSAPSYSASPRRGVAIALWSVAIVIAGLITLVAIKLSSENKQVAEMASTAPAGLLSAVSAIPQAAFDTVGLGSSQGAPIPITAPVLTQDGKPRVVYIGAEYCPYCAAERWPMVVALARFGSFSGLGLTHSASQDVYPNTQTFSFHGASYTSQYLSFTGTETSSNQVQGSGYAKLDTLSSADQSLLSTYDAAPYVAASAAGGIPFIDFGGRYLLNGASYDPSILQGKTAEQIGSALSNPTSTIAKGLLGSANMITAALCSLTKNQPAAVCTSSIQGLETQIDSQAHVGSN